MSRHAAPALEQLDPAVAALLAQLWRADQAGGRAWSLPRLCKQSGLRMSTLRRCLALLAELELACLRLDESGLGDASLTETGQDLCRQLFARTE
ncbi:transcriptional regulator [Chromobacterium phragmitis]|uniref:Transcriptional regulator n=1 Tax=Chromobacterium phragmitis TaxID=2202141 RepID=A0A344UMN2_9NEIS|nr:ArsR family transcriptional regulator [Chromobacterium phragmitis]AXE31146.1 transcriptional regulator [Chromobacterium phragmitis]AXE36530.1 transcriptional regulator [Chromobacterium phragmitis]